MKLKENMNSILAEVDAFVQQHQQLDVQGDFKNKFYCLAQNITQISFWFDRVPDAVCNPNHCHEWPDNELKLSLMFIKPRDDSWDTIEPKLRKKVEKFCLDSNHEILECLRPMRIVAKDTLSSIYLNKLLKNTVSYKFLVPFAI
jgi:hypothetical protein